MDTTLRDGAKSLGITLNLDEKLEIARQLVKLGVDIIEAGYPSCSAGDRDAVRAIAGEIRGAVICGFTRAVEREIDCCAAALHGAEQPRIHTGIAVSPAYMAGKLKLFPAQVMERAVSAVKHAKKYVSDVEFYAEDAFCSDPSFLVEVLEKVIAAGATVVNIPDTSGYAAPWECGDLVTRLMNEVKGIEKVILSIHCHNDLGMATANTLAAVKAGAGQLEATVNGIGERAGNTSLEEAVMAVYTRRAAYSVELKVDTRKISATSRMVSKITGVPVAVHKAIVGANAFINVPEVSLEESLKGQAAYEMIKPAVVGAYGNRTVLSAECTKPALKKALEELGYLMEGENLEEIYLRFLDLARHKSEIFDRDLHLLMEKIKVDSGAISVKNISVTTTGVSRATATVTLDLEGETATDAACGNGPVDAVFKAVERLVGEQVYLEDYSLQSVSQGRESLGDATVKVRYGENGLVVGRGISADVIEASAKAYVNALAKVRTINRGGDGQVQESNN
ncbi:2-isopropylmalate synthase [Pelotomaculum propionicicum]|uniref:2-isopropylmalate synthase n=2 Tax=Pelotomaculum propionicicum TaxID=258475 RepID=A0A4Y7RIH2_9FIRM|nr:2-isopropylmalate synthase [Pelotomaculum propionicicum]